MDNRILIIDDEPTIRKLLARMLELEGYEIFQADDCTSGMKQLTLRRPQLVLCDVFLPDGNGVELVKSIKAVTPDVEVILLTAHGNIPDGVFAEFFFKITHRFHKRAPPVFLFSLLCYILSFCQ